MIKRSVQQKYITFVNIDAPNIWIPKNVGQILTDLKEEKDSNLLMTVLMNNSV